MRYYKQQSDSYILTIGTGYGGEEITEDEYNELMEIINNRPANTTKGMGYRLKLDKTWEKYTLPEVVESDDDELSDGETLNILLGVTE